MRRHTVRAAAQAEARHSARPRVLELAAGAATLAAGTLVVFHGALRQYFAQEDFLGLAAAAGVLPRHATLWRYASAQGFMDLFYPLFGNHAAPYHAISITLHAAVAIGLFVLLSRRVAGPAALVGAALFAMHPALFTALYWISARGDLLASVFSLAGLVFALRPGRERWLAVPTFAIALTSKESVLLWPVAVWLIRGWAGSPLGRVRFAPDALDLSLAGVSLAFGAYLATGSVAGIGVGTGDDSAYALDFGAPLLQNLTTYVGWTVDVAMRPSPLRFVDVRNPAMLWPGIATAAVWALGCLAPSLRARGWHIAGISFLVLLAPVLPLRNHTYHYFIYAPLAAATWILAAGLDVLLARMSGRGRARVPEVARSLGGSAAWWFAGAAVLVLAWNGASLVHTIETRPMRVYPALRGDPIVDRSRIARKVIEGLSAAQLPEDVDLVFLFRERLALLARIARGSGEDIPPPGNIYPEDNVTTALMDGAAVRAIFPNVRSVVFVRDSIPVSEASRCAVYAATGDLEVFSPEGIDSLLASDWVLRW